MTVENGVLDLSFEAGEDLSSNQYRVVVFSSTTGVHKVIRPDAQANIPAGILQNAPESGEAATVRIFGQSKVVCGEALTTGFVRLEYNTTTDSGKVVALASNEGYRVGLIVEGTDAEDDLGSILIDIANPGI